MVTSKGNFILPVFSMSPITSTLFPSMSTRESTTMKYLRRGSGCWAWPPQALNTIVSRQNNTARLLLSLIIGIIPSSSRTTITKQRRERRGAGIGRRWQAKRPQGGGGYHKIRDGTLLHHTYGHARAGKHERNMQATA